MAKTMDKGKKLDKGKKPEQVPMHAIRKPTKQRTLPWVTLSEPGPSKPFEPLIGSEDTGSDCDDVIIIPSECEGNHHLIVRF